MFEIVVNTYHTCTTKEFDMMVNIKAFLLLIGIYQFSICIGTCSAMYCDFWEFQCNSGHCINQRFYCDGIIDCPDGSDEIIDSGKDACSNLENNSTLKCKLPHSYVCDGVHHCQNKIDEGDELCKGKKYKMNCVEVGFCVNKFFLNCSDRPEWSCSSKVPCQGKFCTLRGGASIAIVDLREECGEIPLFRCNSGECLAPEQFCDGNIDCDDGSDEILANGTNVGDGISCSNKWNQISKQCVLPSRYMCDKIDHCDNNVDECEPDCKNAFICGNGKCIKAKKMKSSQYICNGRDDCGDSSDECLEECKQHKFTCNDGTCIALELFCDGRRDCLDGSDEVTEETDGTSGIMCASRYNPSSKRCLLPKNHICDDVRHCSKSEDEMHCNDSSWFRCGTNRTVHVTTQVCNFQDDCHDSSDECEVPGGCNKTFTCVSNGKCIAFSKFCDGTKDCEDGSDEEGLEGTLMCNNAHNKFEKQCILPQRYVCDSFDHCENRTDECGTDCLNSFFCNDGQCIERRHFCDGINHCQDESDELTSVSGFKCHITQSRGGVVRFCVLPQNMLSDSVIDCAQGSDDCSKDGSCFMCLTGNFYVSSQQVCDGILDCPDLSDECFCATQNETVRVVCENYCNLQESEFCNKCNKNEIACDGGSTCLPIQNVCDGTVQCKNRADEIACKPKDKVSWSEKPANLNFTCAFGDPKQATQCDGIPQCGFAEDECSKIKSGPKKGEFVCGEKTIEVCNLVGKDGVPHCPAQRRQILRKTLCDGVEDCQKPSNGDLSADEMGCKDRVRCPKSRPKEAGKSTIHISRFCDERIDCEDEEDEAEELCKNKGHQRFYCESRGMETNNGSRRLGPLFVYQQQVLDGNPNCWDGSDECPTKLFSENTFSSRHRMIRNVLLSVVVWIMGILASFGNFVVMWHSITKIRSQVRFSPMMRSNYILVFNLAAADFLMGVYLLALAFQNAITNGSYCKFDQKWRSGATCAALGSLAMMSIQASVCFLVLLTTYRMVAVLRPFSVEDLKVRYTVGFVSLTWFFSLLLAIVPRLPGFEEYFVSSALISPGVYFFNTNSPTKQELNVFAKTLMSYSNVSSSSESLSWKEIHSAITTFYPTNWPELKIIREFGYYSAHSVCLPKLFVKVNEGAWAYTLIVMLLDFMSFLYIATAYRVIYLDAARLGALGQNQTAADENKTLQSRITRLVLADFLCLVPVCLIAFLSVMGVSINPVAYAVAAIVLFPINSALNPILYSNVTGVLYSSCIAPATACVQKIIRRRQRIPFIGDQQFTPLERQSSSYNRCMNSVTLNDVTLDSEKARLGSDDSLLGMTSEETTSSKT